MPLAAAWRLAAALSLFFLQPALAEIETIPEGRVRFYQIADSDFDPWTRAPDEADKAFMRQHYFRMETYSSYFTPRLAWYPNAWVYKDSYAIKPAWEEFREHPEWVLRDRRGQRLYIDWGCKDGRCPQYAADIGNPAFRRWWIGEAQELLRLGYIGLWIDDVNMTWRFSDGQSDDVRPVDPRTGTTMTIDDWRRYFANFMTEVRAAMPRAELSHNVIWYAGSPTDPSIVRQIEAADYISLERGVSDKGLRGGSGRWGFETFLSFVDAVHQLGRAVVFMDYGTTIADREYGLAGWFLINNGRDMMSSNRPEWTAPDRWWRGYGLDLGRARRQRYQWQGVLRRDFDCGIVLLNQPDMPTRELEPGPGYRDIKGRPVASVTLAARSAAVLQGACATAH